MNIKIAIISTLAIAAATVSVQPASAKGNRFDFAPNVWRSEEIRKPEGYGVVGNQPQHAVRHGNVTPGRQLLGIDPAMLRRPTPRVAPVAQTQVAANPLGSFTNMIPKVNPFQPGAFSAKFGDPLKVNAPPVMANLPPAAQPAIPQQATAQPLPPGSSSKGVSGRLSAPHRSTAVRGRLNTPRRAVGLAARPATPIQSYGSMGYKQGTFIPAGSGYGMSTQTSVAGKVLRH